MSALKAGWWIPGQKTSSSEAVIHNSENDLWFSACFMHTVSWFGTKAVEWELEAKNQKSQKQYIHTALLSLP